MARDRTPAGVHEERTGRCCARRLGAPVRRHDQAEIGRYRLRTTAAGRDGAVLAPLGESTQVFQWHGCRFEVPTDAVHLAQTDGCPPQAFRYGDNAYGFQFHLEMDQPLIERWLTTPSYRDELNAAGIGDESIREQTRQHIETMQLQADAVFNGFLDLVGRPHRSQVLRSREWA